MAWLKSIPRAVPPGVHGGGSGVRAAADRADFQALFARR